MQQSGHSSPAGCIPKHPQGLRSSHTFVATPHRPLSTKLTLAQHSGQPVLEASGVAVDVVPTAGVAYEQVHQQLVVAGRLVLALEVVLREGPPASTPVSVRVGVVHRHGRVQQAAVEAPGAEVAGVARPLFGVVLGLDAGRRRLVFDGVAALREPDTLDTGEYGTEQQQSDGGHRVAPFMENLKHDSPRRSGRQHSRRGGGGGGSSETVLAASERNVCNRARLSPPADFGFIAPVRGEEGVSLGCRAL